MHRIRLLGAALLLTVLVAVTAFAAPSAATPSTPPGPSLAHGFLMAPSNSPANPGVTKPITYFHQGLNVWVSAQAAQRDKVAKLAKYSAAQLRRYGVPIRFKGFAKSRKAEKGTDGTRGAVHVTTLPEDNRVCRRLKAGKPGLGAHVVFHSVAILPGLREIELSDVDFCRGVLTENIRNAVSLHEFAHVVGLGNIKAKYRGKTQVMQVTRSLPAHFQRGDINGLRYVNYQAKVLRRPIRLQGQIETLKLRGHTVRASGWALTGRDGKPAAVSLTVDGKPLPTDGLRAVARPDIARRFHSFEKHAGFRFSARASGGSHRYCIAAAAFGQHVTLGCATLSVAAPPSRTPGSGTSSAPAQPSSAPAKPSLPLTPPGAQPASSSSSGPGIGVIAGIVAAVVIIGVIIALLIRNRRRLPAAAAVASPEPMQFWPTLPVQTAQPPSEQLGQPPTPPPPDARPQHLPPPQVWAPQPPPPSRPEDQPPR